MSYILNVCRRTAQGCWNAIPTKDRVFKIAQKSLEEAGWVTCTVALPWVLQRFRVTPWILPIAGNCMTHALLVAEKPTLQKSLTWGLGALIGAIALQFYRGKAFFHLASSAAGPLFSLAKTHQLTPFVSALLKTLGPASRFLLSTYGTLLLLQAARFVKSIASDPKFNEWRLQFACYLKTGSLTALASLPIGYEGIEIQWKLNRVDADALARFLIGCLENNPVLFKNEPRFLQMLFNPSILEKFILEAECVDNLENCLNSLLESPGDGPVETQTLHDSLIKMATFEDVVMTNPPKLKYLKNDNSIQEKIRKIFQKAQKKAGEIKPLKTQLKQRLSQQTAIENSSLSSRIQSAFLLAARIAYTYDIIYRQIPIAPYAAALAVAVGCFTPPLSIYANLLPLPENTAFETFKSGLWLGNQIQAFFF